MVEILDITKSLTKRFNKVMTEDYIQYAGGYQKDNIDELDIVKAING
ncbi:MULTISPECIES: hypothetical protein [Elizabethkingia]|nr:hypothetical protein [Elizabethkingia sp. 2-6]